jgi:polyisoprenoid-binding protein YceI
MLDAVNNAVNQAGELVFDLTSFTAETQASRAYVGLKGEANATDRPKITANMLGTEVLDSGRFATATYKIRQATLMPQRQPTDPSWYQFEGDLTLHGVTRPVRVQAVVEPAENMLRVRGQFSLLQTQFGIKPYSKAFGAVGVADEVKVWADLWIKAR